MKNKKVLIIFAVGLLILTAIGAFLVLSSHRSPENTAPNTATTTGETVTKRPPFAEPRTPPQGYKEYRSVFYRFQFFYPDNLTVTEEKVPTSALMLTFESPDKNQGFQIFIVPHGDPTITDYRLEQDLPSGKMESPQATKIGGVDATAFLSDDPSLGERREVWFINKGFLYEVSAPIKLDSWLSNIMTSWMFL